jgi:hypothetical protein
LAREQEKNNPATDATKRDKRRVNVGWKLALQTGAGKASGFLLFWPFWERFTHALWHLQPVPHAPYRLLQIRFTHHHGKPIDLPDGTHVSKGDPIIELHFRGQAFLDTDEQMPRWRYMQIIKQNFSALANWMQEPDFPSNACAIYGNTLLYRGAVRLGFTLRERPKTLYTYLERFFMMGLMVLYHRQGSARLLQGKTYETYPQETWMSRKEWLRLYGNASSLGKGGKPE